MAKKSGSSGGSPSNGTSNPRGSGDWSRAGVSSAKSLVFKGLIPELRDHYFDCSSSSAAERYTKTLRAIQEYISDQYEDREDTSICLQKMKTVEIPPPSDPADKYVDVVEHDMFGNIIPTRDHCSYLELQVF